MELALLLSVVLTRRPDGNASAETCFLAPSRPGDGATPLERHLLALLKDHRVGGAFYAEVPDHARHPWCLRLMDSEFALIGEVPVIDRPNDTKVTVILTGSSADDSGTFARRLHVSKGRLDTMLDFYAQELRSRVDWAVSQASADRYLPSRSLRLDAGEAPIDKFWNGIAETISGHRGIQGLATTGMEYLGANVVVSEDMPGPRARVTTIVSPKNGELANTSPESGIVPKTPGQMKGHPSRRPALLILASPSLRRGPSAPLLQLVRRHARTLRKFRLLSTDGTGAALQATGVLEPYGVQRLLAGHQGGVVEAAARVVRGDACAAVHLLDPSDWHSELPENVAFQRVCRSRGVRLVSTIADFERWLLTEAGEELEASGPARAATHRERPRIPSIPSLPPRDAGSRTPGISSLVVAMIAQDSEKGSLLKLAWSQRAILSSCLRVLATGQTGFALRCLFSSTDGKDELADPDAAWIPAPRRRELCELALATRAEARQIAAAASEPLDALRRKILVLEGGQFGGCVLIADAVLRGHCHVVIALEADGRHFGDDVHLRVLERSCRFTGGNHATQGVMAIYLGERQTAESWLERAAAQATADGTLAESLSRTHRIDEVIAVETPTEDDSDELARELARAAAGYFHEWLMNRLVEAPPILRIAVSHGQALLLMSRAIGELQRQGIVRIPATPRTRIVWVPASANIYLTSQNLDASAIAESFQGIYGGDLERTYGPPLIERRADALALQSPRRFEWSALDFVLLSASHWNPDAALKSRSALAIEILPAPDATVGHLGLIFIDSEGGDVPLRYAVNGLDYGTVRDLAGKGCVLVISGGRRRLAVTRAVLAGRIASVLVTTTGTAAELSPAPPMP